MYYKITKGDVVVDVFIDVVACKYEPRSKCILGCNIDDDPMGIVSARRDTYYHVDGWAEFPFACQTVALANISESEYMELKKQLDKEDAESEAIKKLNDKTNTHDIDIGDLTDAVLELAEIVGGD